MPDRQTLGRLGEGFAAEHYERLGFEVVVRNHRTRFGEIDLVVADSRWLVFCEVKSRRAGSRSPFHSLTSSKQTQVRAMARAYLATVRDRPRAPQIRFDAVGVTIDPLGRLVQLDHIEAAF